MYNEIAGHVLCELTGRQLPAEPVPVGRAAAVDASRYAGTYTCDVGTLAVSQQDDGRIWLDAVPLGDLAEELGDKPERHELVHFDDDTLISRERDGGIHRLYVFLGDDGAGHPAYLHVGRALVRAEP